MSQFRQWLNQPVSAGFPPSNTLDQYFTAMEQHGYDDVSYLCNCTEERLECIFAKVGITKDGHKDRLLTMIAKARAEALLAPAGPVASKPPVSSTPIPWSSQRIGVVGIAPEAWGVASLNKAPPLDRDTTQSPSTGSPSPCGSSLLQDVGTPMAVEPRGKVSFPYAPISETTTTMGSTGITRNATSVALGAQGSSIKPHNISFSTRGQNVILTIPTRSEKGISKTLQTNAKGENCVLGSTCGAHVIPEFDNLIVTCSVEVKKWKNGKYAEPVVIPTKPVTCGKNIKLSVSVDRIITLEIESYIPGEDGYIDDSRTRSRRTVASTRNDKCRKDMTEVFARISRQIYNEVVMIPNSNVSLFLHAYREVELVL